jgi:hypothetical protein
VRDIRSIDHDHGRFDIPRLSSPSRLATLGVVTLLISACGDRHPAANEPEVCAPSERTTLVATRLTYQVPSEPFEASADSDIFVGLIADSDYQANSTFANYLAGIYVIPEGDQPHFIDAGAGIRSSDDPLLSYDTQGQFRYFGFEPGRYQVWSNRAPQIEIVACPRPTSTTASAASGLRPPRTVADVG